MNREFGIYPEHCEPDCWIGTRAIISKGFLDTLPDRWSNEFHNLDRKAELINFINNYALREIEKRVKKNDTVGSFDSPDSKCRCVFDDRNSHGYLYIGFYTL